MKHKKILMQLPGRTIYESTTRGEVYHYFTDIYACPLTSETIEIHGKGALSNRISSYLFKKLHSLGISTHFLRSVNMRESLMYATQPLSFDLNVRCRGDRNIAQTFQIEESRVFEPPLIDYINPQNKSSVTESFIYALEWLSPSEMEELHNLILRTTSILQGLFISCDLHLVTMTLSVGQSSEGAFFLSGHLSPDTFCVWDEQTQEYWGAPYVLAHHAPVMHYSLIASRLRLYELKPEGIDS